MRECNCLVHWIAIYPPFEQLGPDLNVNSKRKGLIFLLKGFVGNRSSSTWVVKL